MTGKIRKWLRISACAAVMLIAAVIFCWHLISPTSKQSQNKLLFERTAIVSYVVDGDTIHLEGDESVRLVGIDTPELRSSDVGERLRAEEAKEFVENLCPSGMEIGLNVDDLEPKDRYSRTLAVVYVKIDNFWTNLNALLLQLGFAKILYVPPSEFNPYEWLS